MLNLFSSISASGAATTTTFLLGLLAALVCGGLTAAAAAYKNRLSAGFAASLILLPAIVMTVIALVNGNVGTGVAVMGAFSLIRFRSVPGKARDIVAIFLVMTAGLACAGGYVPVALTIPRWSCSLTPTSKYTRNQTPSVLKSVSPRSTVGVRRPAR